MRVVELQFYSAFESLFGEEVFFQ